MERVKIDEALIKYRDEHGKKPTMYEVGEYVFKDETSRPKVGKKRPPMTERRKAYLIGRWNDGEHLTACKPRHLLRLSKYFKITNIADLLAA